MAARVFNPNRDLDPGKVLFEPSRSGLSPGTLERYRSEWSRFSQFAKTTPRDSDAPYSQIAQYIRVRFDEGASEASLRAARSAIRYVIQETSGQDPWDHREVRAAWAEATDEREPGQLVEVDLAQDVPDYVRAMADAKENESSPVEVRDRALLLIASGARLGPTEIRRMQVKDARRVAGFLRIELPGSEPVDLFSTERRYDPHRALNRWLAVIRRFDQRLGASGKSPLWRALPRHGPMPTTAISRAAVHKIVQRAAQDAGLDAEGFSAASLKGTA